MVLEIKQEILTIFLEVLDISNQTKNIKIIICENPNKWVDIRISKFKPKTETSSEYKLLTIEDQLNKLNNRIRSLKELVANYQLGKDYFFDDIVANIRSLIFYKMEGKSKNYDPLFLRIASFKKVFLKVYTHPDFGNMLDTYQITTKPRIFHCEDIPYISPAKPNIKEIDFQEYLETPTVEYKDKRMTALDFLEILSTTQSTAHYDQREPKVISELKYTPQYLGHNTINRFFVDMAKLIISLNENYIK